MRIKVVVIFVILIFSSVNFTSCKKEKNGEGSKSSAYNDTSSHNVGTACMDCHNSGGSNEFWWTVAGTVYKPDGVNLNPNSTVYLFTGVNGTGNPVLTLQVDAKGNFYTTSDVNFGSGLYPEVKSSSGEIRFMQQPIANGSCNSCHNASKRITVN